MKIKVQKWGNDYAICLNEDLMNQLNIKVGDALNVIVNNGTLQLRPIAPVYTIDDLLSGSKKRSLTLNDEDLHWLHSPPVGSEFQ